MLCFRGPFDSQILTLQVLNNSAGGHYGKIPNHGTGLTGEWWDPAAAALEEQGCRVNFGIELTIATHHTHFCNLMYTTQLRCLHQARGVGRWRDG